VTPNRPSRLPWARLGGLAAAAFAASTATSACLNFEPFGCQSDTQCDAEMLGRCEAAGFCSYPDLVCLTGYRYESNAGDGLGGECVNPGAATGTDTSGGETDPPLETGASSSSSSGPDPDSGTDDTSTGDACGAGGQTCCAGDTCDDGLACTTGVCSCIATIAVGDRHSCAVRLDGTVWCWGDNSLGQLASPAPEPSLVPVQIAGFGPGSVATQVYARNHTCAHRIDDTVLCWGDNAGQKVDYTDVLEVVTTPVQATWAEPATQIGVGGTHTCVGRGAAFAPTCWGANGSGQLTGMGAPGPAQVGGAIEPAGVALGDLHSCMSATSGQLLCWGDNTYGQLGLDPLGTANSTVPQAVVIDPVEEIVAGHSHTCARTRDQVLCWGRNEQGQIGNDTQVDVFPPTPVVFPPAAGVIVGLSAAADQTCARSAIGDAFCWGGNQFGELLLEPDETGQDGFALTPRAIEPGFAVAQIVTGQTHSCALSITGQLYCWGENGQGQIGDGTMSDAQDPTPVDISCP